MTTVFDALLSEFRAFVEAVDREQVRGFVADVGWAMPARQLAPHGLACLTHLDRAAELAGVRACALAALLAEHRERFHWDQTYTEADFGRHFIDNYGWLEVFGTRGHFANDKVAAGLLILGPGIVYPDHHHAAEEVYIPLTGTADWRMGDGTFVRREAGEIIHHVSNVNHAMRTGRNPLLAIYLWRGGPLAARSTITGTVWQGGR